MTNELIDSLITSLEEIRRTIWEGGEEDSLLAKMDNVIASLRKDKTPSTTDLPQMRINWLETMLEESSWRGATFPLSGEYFWSSLHILLSKYKELEKKNIPLPPPPPPSEAKEFFNNYVEVFFTDKSKIIGIIMEQAKITGASASITAIHSTSLLRKRVWYSVKGTPEALKRFQVAMRHAIDLWWS